jgi:phospholipid/cholesterol/gamma-HCH transport system permease protein
VTSAANLLVGLIIGFIGVSQLGRFGATSYVPELVVVAHFRELGALVTSHHRRRPIGCRNRLGDRDDEGVRGNRRLAFDRIRSGAMASSCRAVLALVIVLPILTWIGDVFALGGALIATTTMTDMPVRMYLMATGGAITGTNFLAGLIKSPFPRSRDRDRRRAVRGSPPTAVPPRSAPARTTAVVMSIFSVIVINAVFTLLFAVMGI